MRFALINPVTKIVENILERETVPDTLNGYIVSTNPGAALFSRQEPDGSFTPAPPRPSKFHVLDPNTMTWVLDQEAVNAVADRELANTFEADKTRRLIFEIVFNQENRLRVLEGRPQITRAQYRDALLNLYKSLS